ncbi:MAG: hypothetical protein AB1489_39320, partial [Acidobacteriota bacterium]
MSASRWEQIEKIFYALLDKKPEQRANLIDEMCAGDLELKKEVESLISAYDKTEINNFIAHPLIAPLRKEKTSALALIGEIIDEKYRIEKLLGQGGMSVVYQATHLGTTRPVALKIIT